jgi:hypothetical protein
MLAKLGAQDLLGFRASLLTRELKRPIHG